MDASTSAGGAAGITRALGRSTGDIEKTKKSTHTTSFFNENESVCEGTVIPSIQ